MNDNLIIENLEYAEEMYKRALEENSFEVDDMHGIGVDSNGNS